MWKTTVLICYLIILSVHDIRRKQLPMHWIVAGAVFAIINILISAGEMLFAPETVLRILNSWLPGMVFLVIAKMTDVIGRGDGWVLIITGSILDAGETGRILAVSLLLAAFSAIVLLVFRKAQKGDKLPFIPFLATAVILVMLV